jgi:hypothetical protein
MNKESRISHKIWSKVFAALAGSGHREEILRNGFETRSVNYAWDMPVVNGRLSIDLTVR